MPAQPQDMITQSQPPAIHLLPVRPFASNASPAPGHDYVITTSSHPSPTREAICQQCQPSPRIWLRNHNLQPSISYQTICQQCQPKPGHDYAITTSSHPSPTRPFANNASPNQDMITQSQPPAIYLLPLRLFASNASPAPGHDYAITTSRHPSPTREAICQQCQPSPRTWLRNHNLQPSISYQTICQQCQPKPGYGYAITTSSHPSPTRPFASNASPNQDMVTQSQPPAIHLLPDHLPTMPAQTRTWLRNHNFPAGNFRRLVSTLQVLGYHTKSHKQFWMPSSVQHKCTQNYNMWRKNLVCNEHWSCWWLGTVIVVSLLMSLSRLLPLSPRKLPLLTISQLWHHAALQNYRLFCTWMHHEYFFLGHQCASMFPIHVRKYRKYTIDRWTVVYTACASTVIEY